MPTPVQSIPYGLRVLANGRDTLPTNEAAPIINRRPQTLRKWACLDDGPIRPVRINGRLAWRVADLAKLLNGAE
ncbi:helix-turn-helix domain-containing protein [Cupriavidus pauculus]|nr:helix-turn-helix domain-containing protein [Cupriavidus pauculus]MCM3608902.1 helix-turn-helix domain-containing protein [Cupriavidus pauculus]